MPTSTTIDGISRELTAWPATIDGVTREHAQLYAAIDGVQREIFSGMHVWARYSIEKYVSVDATPKTIRTYLSKDSDGDYDTDAYLASGSESEIWIWDDDLAVDKKFLTCYVSRGDTEIGSSDKLMMLEKDRPGINNLVSVSPTIYMLGTPGGTLPNGTGSGTSCYVVWNVVKTFTVGKRKGSLVDQIESKNPNAYPVNGISGDCWYVKIK